MEKAAMPIPAVILDSDTLGEGVSLEKIKKKVTLSCFATSTSAQAKHRLRNAQIALVNKVILNKEVLQACPQLQHIFLFATGANNIDLAYCKKNGIRVWPAKQYGSDIVARHALSLMLSLNQQLYRYRTLVNNGAWQKSKHFCLFKPELVDVANKTLGIIGYGSIGKQLAKMCKALGMQVKIARRNSADTRSGRIATNALFKQCDVISLHCPLTKENYHLVNQSRIAMMKPGAILINCSRGGLVDENALAKALRSKKIMAGLDVLSSEPPNSKNPLLHLQLDNLIITPHVAWIPLSARQRLVDTVYRNMEQALK